MTNIMKYRSRRSSSDHAISPSKRSGDIVSKAKRVMRRKMRHALKSLSDDSGGVILSGTYWT